MICHGISIYVHGCTVQVSKGRKATAPTQQGVPHYIYAQMLYVALALLKLTTLNQPATAIHKTDQNGLEVAEDLCWSLLDSLAQQLPDQRMPQKNPVLVSGCTISFQLRYQMKPKAPTQG